MSKSSQAFRTIREVADWLDVAAHVLRFWESKFPQIKPVKRAGGRRYYRPADMALVGGIKVLLHDRGLTIRGVQKMIREDGVAAVAALSPPIDLEDGELIDADAIGDWIDEVEADTGAKDADTDAKDDASERSSQPRFPFVVPSPAAEEKAAEAEPEPEPEPQPEPEHVARIVEDPPAPAPLPEPEAMPDPAPATPSIRLVPDPAAPEDHDPDTAPLDRLAALAARSGRLPPAAAARLRPALAALRDRMRAEPPDPSA